MIGWLVDLAQVAAIVWLYRSASDDFDTLMDKIASTKKRGDNLYSKAQARIANHIQQHR